MITKIPWPLSNLQTINHSHYMFVPFVSYIFTSEHLAWTISKSIFELSGIRITRISYRLFRKQLFVMIKSVNSRWCWFPWKKTPHQHIESWLALYVISFIHNNTRPMFLRCWASISVDSFKKTPSTHTSSLLDKHACFQCVVRIHIFPRCWTGAHVSVWLRMKHGPFPWMQL